MYQPNQTICYRHWQENYPAYHPMEYPQQPYYNNNNNYINNQYSESVSPTPSMDSLNDPNCYPHSGVKIPQEQHYHQTQPDIVYYNHPVLPAIPSPPPSPAYSPQPSTFSQQSPAYSPQPSTFSQQSPAYSPKPSTFSQQSPAYSQQSCAYPTPPPVYSPPPPVYSPPPPTYDSQPNTFSPQSPIYPQQSTAYHLPYPPAMSFITPNSICPVHLMHCANTVPLSPTNAENNQNTGFQIGMAPSERLQWIRREFPKPKATSVKSSRTLWGAAPPVKPLRRPRMSTVKKEVLKK